MTSGVFICEIKLTECIKLTDAISQDQVFCVDVPGRKCLRLDAQDMDEIEKIGGD